MNLTACFDRPAHPRSRSYAVIVTDNRYLDQLRLLAANLPTFDSQLLTEMKSKAFVLGSQLVPKKSKITGKTVEGEFDREWVLCQAKDVSVPGRTA